MKQAPKILIFCNVVDFTAYTRRATLESIARLAPGTKCISAVSYWFPQELRLTSAHMEIIPFFYYLPYKLIRKSRLLNYINYKLNGLRKKIDLDSFDTVILSRPHSAVFSRYIQDKKKIVILSDAYHTMGNTLDETRQLLEMADVVMATSQALKDVYVKKYFGIEDKTIHYWPNCVDLDVWDAEKIVRLDREHKNVVVGFAGNFMEATDIDLLYDVVRKTESATFVLAGKCNYPENHPDKAIFEKVIKLPNVDYKGYIHYTELPQEVMKWDVCIMIDRVSEHASYHHHNKMYQYLALGKTVVYQKNHDDYMALNEVAVGVTGPDEFVTELQLMINKIASGADFSAKAKYLAVENSSDKRAEQLLSVI